MRGFMAAPEGQATIKRVKASAQVEMCADNLHVERGALTVRNSEGINYETQYTNETQRRLTDNFRDARTAIQVETVLAVAIATGGERADEERAGSREDARTQYAELQPATGRGGRITLTHWSDDHRDVIDPTRAGVGPFSASTSGTDGSHRNQGLGDMRREIEQTCGEIDSNADDGLA